jgi:long-chain fatty acid transport protein
MSKQRQGMSNGVAIVVCTTVLATMGVHSARGHAFRNPPGSAEALALDGAKSVMVDDASAISVNPANLADIDRPTVSISLTLIEADASFTSTNGVVANAQNTLKTLANLYAATPLGDGDIVFGLGITTPYGQSVEWAKESRLPYFTEMFLVDIAPTLATRLSDSVSVGAGLDIYYSELELRNLVDWVPGNPAAAGTAEFRGDGMAMGGTLGLTWDVTEEQHAALVYHSPFSIDYEGTAEFSAVPASLAALGIRTSTDFETTIKFPTIVSLAYAIDLSDAITVGAEVEWVEFSRFETLPLDIGANGLLQSVPNGLPTEIRQNWNDVWTYGVAGSWQSSDSVQLRASCRYMESPIPDSTLAPTLPDGDKYTFGLGLGWEGENQAIDLGYMYSIIDDREVTNNQNPLFDGTYETESHIVTLSYSYYL